MHYRLDGNILFATVVDSFCIHLVATCKDCNGKQIRVATQNHGSQCHIDLLTQKQSNPSLERAVAHRRYCQY